MSEEKPFLSLLLTYDVQAVEKAVVAEVLRACPEALNASCPVSQAAADESTNKGTRGEEAHSSSSMEKIRVGG